MKSRDTFDTPKTLEAIQRTHAKVGPKQMDDSMKPQIPVTIEALFRKRYNVYL